MGMEKGTFGKAIQSERERQGIHIDDLAYAAGCSGTNLRNIERRGQDPKGPLMDALLTALGVKLTLGRVDGRKKLDMGNSA